MNFAYVRRFWLAGLVLAAVLVLLPFSFHAEQHLETATRIEGSEATTVAQELSTRFHSPFVDRVVLVIQGLPPADSEEGEQRSPEDENVEVSTERAEQKTVEAGRQRSI